MHGNVHKNLAAMRCIKNRFRIESLTSDSESNRIESNSIVWCQEIPTPSHQHIQEAYMSLWPACHLCMLNIKVGPG